MSFRVLKRGFFATVQDAGRTGSAHFGMNHSGALDEHAYRWANFLVDNPTGAAVLEIALGQFELQSLSEKIIAVCGADLNFQINQKPAPMWRSVEISSGDKLSWRRPKSGVYAYLATSGGFETEAFFGSKSVNIRERIGRKIAVDDNLAAGASHKNPKRVVPVRYIPDYRSPLVLRILPSYQFENFPPSERQRFFGQNYQITPAFDRSGFRLEGAPLRLEKNRMISEGISPGSVEITPDGQPIILLKDAPTIGGYPKIGTVFSLDLARLAQRQAGATLRFETMTIFQAQKKRRIFNEFFKIDG